MEMRFSDAEGRVLHGLIEDASGDIVVRLDAAGFILHASDNAAQLGLDLTEMLLMPHIADFAAPGHGAEVARYVTQRLSGEGRGGWVEFPVEICTGDAEEAEQPHSHSHDCLRWFAFSLRAVAPDDGVPQGALGLLRSVQHRHALEDELTTSHVTDPLTGLANRHAFAAAMRRALSSGRRHTLAVFAIDRLRAIFMQYGQATADEIQWGFAKYLETMTWPGQTLAQAGGGRLGVLLPGMCEKDARRWACDVIETFAGLAVPASAKAPELTASAGLAQLENSVDWTLRQAELGLVMAQAGGGMQVSRCKTPKTRINDGAAVERAIREAVNRAGDRHQQRRAER